MENQQKTLLPTVKNKPFLIAGPCSAETEEQLIQSAKLLKKTGKIHMLRAGIWKPRTRPGSFEGVGEVGLDWLIKARQETNLPVITEVAKASHVEICLKKGIDALWIGARTTVNPFAIQELADALKGVDIPVYVKNPINPDLALWIGAMERLMMAGLTQLGAIHRGFSNAGEKIFRNRPQWQIAIDFKSNLPEIPLICDPSHICGNRTLLQEVSQKAMDLNFDGLMIESHLDPDNAWSDARQQITPNVYANLINNLVIRKTETSPSETSHLERIRKQIDLLDDELIHLLASRMKLAREIGEYKKEHQITILQTSRWSDIQKKYQVKGQNHQLSNEFVSKFIKAVHDESINQQETILNSK